MIMEIIQFAVGSFAALFLTGYLITECFFREFKGLEKVAFSIAFSIMVDVAIAIFLGYDEAQAARTGGLNFINIAKAELVVIIALGLVLLYKNRKSFKKAPISIDDGSKKGKRPGKIQKK